MVASFRQADDVAGLRLGVDELALGITALRHVDRKRKLGRVDRLFGYCAADPQAPRRQAQPLGSDLRADRHLFGGACEAEGGVHDIVARREGQRGRGQIGFDDKRVLAVGVRASVEHAPANASGKGGRCAVQVRRKAKRRLPFGRRRVGERGRRQRREGDNPDESRENPPDRSHSAPSRRIVLPPPLRAGPRAAAMRRIEGGLHPRRIEPSSAEPMRTSR